MVMTATAYRRGEYLQLQNKVVRPSPPNRVAGPPVISGTPTVGSVLTATGATWLPVVTVLYEWLRNGIPIGGATGVTYTVTAEDVGAELVVREYATTAEGGRSYSNSLPVIGAEAPPPP